MTTRPDLSKVWASSSEADVRDIPSDLYLRGWIDKQKPEHYHQNKLQKSTNDYLVEVTELGIPDWRNYVTYKVGSVVRYATITYVSKSDKNTNNQPDTSSVWEVSIGAANYEDTVNHIRHIEKTIDDHRLGKQDPHDVTPMQAGTYSKEESNTISNNFQQGINSHKADKGNPHKVTYSQLDILPVSGGDFTGQVDFGAGRLGIGEGFVNCDNTQINIQLGSNRLQLKDDTYFNDEYLLNEFNYTKMDNIFNPKYAVPPTGFHIPMHNSLTAWHGCIDGVTTSWEDVVYTDNMLQLAGTVSFDAADGLGQELTIGIRTVGNVEAVFGDITIHNDAGDITVQDGLHQLTKAGSGDGFYLYTRSSVGGVLYKDGVEAANANYTASTAHTSSHITGTGRISDLQFWSSALTKEQATQVR